MDGYGALRELAELLASNYAVNHDATSREPMGDNVAGSALLKQSVKLGETFSDTVVMHKTVGLAAHLSAAKADASKLEEKRARLKAILDAVAVMVTQRAVHPRTARCRTWRHP